MAPTTTRTIRTLGTAVIEQRARAVRVVTDGDERWEVLQSATERVLKTLQGYSFLETVLFADRVYQTFETTQVAEQHEINTSDWRESLWDLYHLVESAIDAQASSPLDQAALSNEETWAISFDIDEAALGVLAAYRDVYPESHPTASDFHAAGMPSADDFDWVVIMDHLAEEYGLTSWQGMTDTAMRESFTHTMRPAAKFRQFEELFYFDEPWEREEIPV